MTTGYARSVTYLTADNLFHMLKSVILGRPHELVFVTDASEDNAKLFRNNDDALILSVSDCWGKKKNSRQEDREVRNF
jgi:hypothetical protein